MSDLTTDDYAEYAHHLREAGQTVTADVIDALLHGLVFDAGSTAVRVS
jgi:acetyl esterase/lipase